MAVRKAKSLADLSHPAVLRKKIDESEAFLQTSDARRNAAAFVAGQRFVVELHEKLEAAALAAQKPADDPTANMTDAQIIGELIRQLLALPVSMLDDVLDGVGADRHPRDE